MKKIVIILNLLLIFLPQSIDGQGNDDLFTRLHGISDGLESHLNVDGIYISILRNTVEFSNENCEKLFTWMKRTYNLDASELPASDTSLDFENYYIADITEEKPNFFRSKASYFVAGSDNILTEITFEYINKRDKEFELNFIRFFRNNLIPDSVYSTRKTALVRDFNFAGRNISLPLRYIGKWLDVNTLETFADGGISWSVHKDLEDALATIHNYVLIASWEEGVEAISDTTVNVIFEGVATPARKIIYRATNGSVTTTVYYVAAPVRGNFVSCILDFRDNDQINTESGLPFLLEQVMKLE